jgi:hypothetical protein
MPAAYLDYALTQLSTDAETVAICSAAPTTYFNCVKGDLWTASTAVTLGEVRYPPTWNDFVYECIVAGTTGATEPAWGTLQDDEFTDGSVTWKTHENYSLVNDTIGAATITSETFGKRLTFSGTTGALTHTSGTVTHTAIMSDTNQELLYVIEATTTEEGTDDVLSGRLVQINDIIIDRNDLS